MDNEDYWKRVNSGQIKAYYNDAAFLRTMEGKPTPDWVRVYRSNPAPHELWMIDEHENYLARHTAPKPLANS